MNVPVFFFIKQKPGYEMRISDWSSDVCSSYLLDGGDGASWHAPSPKAATAPPPLRLGDCIAKSRCLPHQGGGRGDCCGGSLADPPRDRVPDHRHRVGAVEAVDGDDAGGGGYVDLGQPLAADHVDARSEEHPSEL